MPTDTNILEIEALCVEAGGKELLHHLDLAIPEGEVHALLGQNGSGKTTLMMTIMGYSGYQVTHGEIRFKGQDITALNVTQRARLGIGIAMQRPPTIPGVTLRKLLAYELEHTRAPADLAELVKIAEIEPFLNRSINDGLSGGEIKRAELAQLLAMSPEFSMMDEPDSGVDIEALSLVGKLIHRLFSPDKKHPVKRKAGLIITHGGHVLNQYPIDKAHVMHDGKIGCSGNPAMIVEAIGVSGYEACVRCMETR